MNRIGLPRQTIGIWISLMLLLNGGRMWAADKRLGGPCFGYKEAVTEARHQFEAALKLQQGGP